MFPQLPVTSYTLSSLTSMCSHLHVSPSSITLWLTNVPTVTSYPTTLVSVHQHHSFSIWLQVIKDLLMFPQLPVTSYTLSSLTSMCSHLHVSPSSITLWLQGMSGLPQFPQLPVTQPPLSQCVPITLSLSGALIIYCSSASRNERLTTDPTVTSCLPPLATVCPIIYCSFIVSNTWNHDYQITELQSYKI